jgi:signal transduction histidine kinase
MSRRYSSLHLVGDSASRRAEAACAASRGIEPGAPVRHSPNLLAATAVATEGLEVLVLLEPSPEDFKTAFAALDPRGLPRWAVVPPWPADSPDSDPLEWEPPTLGRSICFAVALLALRRDKARLSGDLGIVGRRLVHDLRTPLNSISMANEALASLEGAPEAAPALHQSIFLAVEETGTLIERVGTVLHASARPVDKQTVEMEEIVWSARESLDACIRSARAQILAPEKWPLVSAAPALLKLVWMNLLSNCVQHGGPAPRIELGWQRADAHTCFWVRDSGGGVPPAKRARLFHPLDRLNEFNAPCGYGLSLVHRLIELHGGTVGYAPDPAPGGTFYFTLPDLT